LSRAVTSARWRWRRASRFSWLSEARLAEARLAGARLAGARLAGARLASAAWSSVTMLVNP